MKLIDKAVQHKQSIECEPIEVPEWETTIYYDPVSLEERKQIARRSGGDTYEAAAYGLITKAKDKEGNPLFTLDDKPKLMKSVDSSIIERIYLQMNAAKSVEEMEKN